ncbi:DUF2628 domain-containing protein [Litchfieldia alkalitelluris]|uniref:DUF2628 domain-containing protein n=1 Tax=Litchfieldia alkalitelluris TaxID=304268 RepID=UPI001473BFF3|nr:DUF2628 domain-containing protein [Litchfieldia alkalitelluris]
MFCINCGSKLEENSKFCHHCGHAVPLNKESVQRKEEKIDTTVQQVNHIDQVEVSTSVEPNGKALEVDDRLLSLFVGEKKKDYYLKKWAKGDRSWNWAAFFLSFFWLGYRKIYKPILIMMAIFLAIDLVVVLIGLDDTNINNAIGISVAVYFGIWGNFLYRKHASKHIKEMINQHQSDEIIERELKIRGGGSWKGVFVALGLFVSYLVLAMVIFMFVPSIPQFSEVNPVNTSLEIPVNQENTNEDIEAEITDFLHANIEALENEDLDEYMLMVYQGEDPSLYNQTQGMLEVMFESYDITYDISDIEFLTVSDQEVKVRLTQTSILVDGEEYQDNETIMIHTVKPQDGRWKFFESEIESVHYLDEEEEEVVTNTDQVVTSNDSPYIKLEADDMFDFRVTETIDVNNDGVFETVILQGAPEDGDSYLNENVEIIVEFDGGSTSVIVSAENAPSLYVYDIDQDGWMDLLYETGYRIHTVDMYLLGKEGLEYYTTFDGSVEDLRPYEVVTDSDTYTFNEAAATTTSFDEAINYYDQSCISCHGASLEGGVGPALYDIGSKLTQGEIEDVIINGQGIMPGRIVSESESEIIAEWLASLK